MRAARTVAIRLALLALFVAALGYTLHALGPGRVLELVARADPAWLALSVVAILGRYGIWAVKWTRMLRRQGEVGAGLALRAVLAGSVVNLVTPTAKLAGGVLRGALVHRRTRWGMATSFGWSLADQVTNVLGTLALGGALAMAASLGSAGPGVRGLFLAVGAAALALPVAAVSLRGWAWNQVRRPALARLAARLTPARLRADERGGTRPGWLLEMLAPLLRVGPTARVAVADVGLAALSWLSLCVANALALRALGVEAPLLAVATALILAAFAGTVTGALGGIGATELALIGLYTRLGIAPEAAAAGALLHRATYYAVSLVLGSAALLWEGGRGAAEAA